VTINIPACFVVSRDFHFEIDFHASPFNNDTTKFEEIFKRVDARCPDYCKPAPSVMGLCNSMDIAFGEYENKEEDVDNPIRLQWQGMVRVSISLNRSWTTMKVLKDVTGMVVYYGCVTGVLRVYYFLSVKRLIMRMTRRVTGVLRMCYG